MHQYLLLTFLPYIAVQGFKRFLRVTWEPFEGEFQSIENRFIHHANVVVRLADVQHKIHYYKAETRQES